MVESNRWKKQSTSTTQPRVSRKPGQVRGRAAASTSWREHLERGVAVLPSQAARPGFAPRPTSSGFAASTAACTKPRRAPIWRRLPIDVPVASVKLETRAASARPGGTEADLGFEIFVTLAGGSLTALLFCDQTSHGVDARADAQRDRYRTGARSSSVRAVTDDRIDARAIVLREHRLTSPWSPKRSQTQALIQRRKESSRRTPNRTFRLAWIAAAAPALHPATPSS
jgi:hypothetical protein